MRNAIIVLFFIGILLGLADFDNMLLFITSKIVAVLFIILTLLTLKIEE